MTVRPALTQRDPLYHRPMTEEAPRFWYNSRTGQVEEGMLSPSVDRVGPFVTADEARHAPEKLADNARRWQEEDEAEE